MFEGKFLYDTIADKRVVFVGFELKSIWQNGRVTEGKKIVARFYILDAGDAPLELRVSLPYSDGIIKRLAGMSGTVVGIVRDVFGVIDVTSVYSYNGTLKTSYIGFESSNVSLEFDIG